MLREHYAEVDSHVRKKERWFADVPQHIEDFLARGGVIYEAAPGESRSVSHKTNFVINPAKTRETR